MSTRGFFDGIDEERYHGDPDSLSVSGAKILLNEGPAAFKWAQEHRRMSDAFDFGHAAHALVLGIGAELVVHEFDPEKVKSPKSTNAWKAQQAEVRETGGILLLPEEMAQVRAMADRLSEHTLAMRLLSTGRPEVSIYCPDETTGVMRRGRVDWLHPSLVVDYKTTVGNVHPMTLAGRYGTVRKWGYDQQAAWYTDLLRDLGHPASAFALIFQSKSAPYPVTVATIDDDDLWDARAKNADALALFRRCTESGRWPDPVSADGWVRLSLTDQSYVEEHLSA